MLKLSKYQYQTRVLLLSKIPIHSNLPTVSDHFFLPVLETTRGPCHNFCSLINWEFYQKIHAFHSDPLLHSVFHFQISTKTFRSTTYTTPFLLLHYDINQVVELFARSFVFIPSFKPRLLNAPRAIDEACVSELNYHSSIFTTKIALSTYSWFWTWKIYRIPKNVCSWSVLHYVMHNLVVLLPSVMWKVIARVPLSAPVSCMLKCV